MVETARVRSTRPWIHVGAVVFADDTLGIDERGEPARVSHDVVVAAIIPAPDGATLVILRPLPPGRAAAGR